MRQCPLLQEYFYPRPPRGGRQETAKALQLDDIISIHALREEGDLGFMPSQTRRFERFLSTPSARRATFPFQGSGLPGRNFYPRPPRGGRRWRTQKPGGPCLFLSTPSARRATYTLSQIRRFDHISIHALREEGDAGLMQHQRCFPKFLSTPSARRATLR